MLDPNVLPVQEGGRKPPPYPSIFVKPSTSVADWGEDIPIPKLAQEDQCDYEGELVGAYSISVLCNDSSIPVFGDRKDREKHLERRVSGLHCRLYHFQ